MTEKIALLRKFILYHSLMIWRTKAFWIRALLCWAISAAFLINDEASNFDLRLQIRGPQRAKTGIVIVDVSEREWTSLDPETRNILRPLKEVMSFSDAFFWNTRAWERLLERILIESPAAIGVTFYFGENIRLPYLSYEARRIFENPRVIWGADVDSGGRGLIPVFASTFNNNIGLRWIRADDDGIVRRFSSSPVHIPHLAVRVAEIANPKIKTYSDRRFLTSALINFSGGAETFDIIGIDSILSRRLPPGYFNGKIVLIGSLSSVADQMQTPLGRMSRVEIMANIVDNVLKKKTILRLPMAFYLAILAALMVAAIWILSSYPQSVALLFFVLTAMVWAALSTWFFDVAYIWLPVISPLVLLTVTYIVFLSYQLAVNEQRTWRLEQEQRYLSEIEQLKTNFVSMMSHDLKTPIAKIQAICDRLLASVPSSELAVDLKTLRRSSDDLHRYIQSILQVTKVEAKDFKINKEVTDINENIEKVIVRLSPLAQEKNIRLVTNLEPMFSIEADTTLIQEVIHNLIENAIKYTPPGGQVAVTSQEKDDNVMVVVEDTGPGIDPEDQLEIWGKFTRGKHVNLETKGTGLGLYLVKYFIELHGGHVFLESTIGVGTRIGFSIPVSDSEEMVS